MADAARDGAQSPSLRGRVLVAEDDDQVRRALVRSLSLAGYEVAAAENGREASELLANTAFDAIVSDIAMPDEDGYWLMNRIRALPGELGRTPAVALTALARSEDRARVLQAGYQLYFTKPVRLGELQEGLAMLIAQDAERRSSDVPV